MDRTQRATVNERGAEWLSWLSSPSLNLRPSTLADTLPLPCRRRNLQPKNAIATNAHQL